MIKCSALEDDSDCNLTDLEEHEEEKNEQAEVPKTEEELKESIQGVIGSIL